MARDRTRQTVLEARHAAPTAIRRLIHECEHADTATARISAATQILDRALGKPPQSLDVYAHKSIMELNLEQIAELEARLTGIAAAPMLIEHEPAVVQEEQQQHQDTTEYTPSVLQTEEAVSVND